MNKPPFLKLLEKGAMLFILTLKNNNDIKYLFFLILE